MFQKDWSWRGYIHLFPPPAASILTKVVQHLRSYKGKVLLVAPYWLAPSWFGELKEKCPRPLPLGIACMSGNLASQLQASFKSSCLEFLTQGLQHHYSGDALTTMFGAKRPSSIRQYESCWRQFQGYISTHRVTEINQSSVLNFLDWLAKTGNRAPSTVAAHISALVDPLRFGLDVVI